MVCPTICGKITLARLHVRNTFFSPFWFIASIRFKSLGSINGPFFNDLDISYLLSISGSSCYDDAQYTGRFSCYDGSCNPEWACPMGFLVLAVQSVDDLHHHRGDGLAGSLLNHARLGECPYGVCGLPYRVLRYHDQDFRFDQRSRNKPDGSDELPRRAYGSAQNRLLSRATEPRHLQSERVDHPSPP